MYCDIYDRVHVMFSPSFLFLVLSVLLPLWCALDRTKYAFQSSSVGVRGDCGFFPSRRESTTLLFLPQCEVE